MASQDQDHPSLSGNGFSDDHHSVYNRRFTGSADQGPSASSSSSTSASMSFATHRQQHQHHQHHHPQPPRDEHPRPYQGRSSPFPLPTNKRSLGGLAALDDHQGADVMSALFGSSKQDGRPQPAPLGKTRCYWALLSYQSSASNPYDMTFVYADPVLQSHLGTEADDLIGKSFFDFVHPNEKQRAKEDMQNIVSSRTLFGSVTRCRYWRVPAIRKSFGNPNPPIAPESHLYVEDDYYLPIDVVLNMVSDSLALCFFHAIINKSIMDNSETDKTDWTNWCGTARELFDIEQCNKLWSSVIAQQANKRRQEEPAVPPYVFQILSMPNAPTAAPGSSSTSSASINQCPEVLFSWPPPRLYRHDAAIGSRRDEEQFHEAFEDGSYFADDFAKLAVNVQASPSARTEDGTTARNGDPGTIQDGRVGERKERCESCELTCARPARSTNTSCTRRFRAKHTLTSEGMLRAVESVLVPYGSIMFACFSTTYQQIIQHHAGGLHRGVAGWPQQAGFVDGALATTPQTLSISADEPPRKKTRDARISPPTQTFMPSHWASGSGSGPTHDLGSPTFSPGSHLHHAQGHSQEGSSSSSNDQQQQQQAGEPFWARPPQPRQSPTTSTNAKLPDDLSNSTDPVIAQATAAASLFAEINPETGEKRCTSCGTSNSPEWRKGPTGTKTLCNACGLRFSRSINRQSKKEEKARKQLAAQQAAIDVLEGRAVMKQKNSGKGAGSPGSAMSLPASQALYAQQALTGEQPFYPGALPQTQSQGAPPTQPQVKLEEQADERAHHLLSHDGAVSHHGGHYDERGHGMPQHQQQQQQHQPQPYPSDSHAYYSHPEFSPAAHYQHHSSERPPGLHFPQQQHQQQHHPHHHHHHHQQPVNGYGVGPQSHDQDHLAPAFHPYPAS